MQRSSPSLFNLCLPMPTTRHVKCNFNNNTIMFQILLGKKVLQLSNTLWSYVAHLFLSKLLVFSALVIQPKTLNYGKLKRKVLWVGFLQAFVELFTSSCLIKVQQKFDKSQEPLVCKTQLSMADLMQHWRQCVTRPPETPFTPNFCAPTLHVCFMYIFNVQIHADCGYSERQIPHWNVPNKYQEGQRVFN